MLEISKVEELVKIVTAAAKRMDEQRYPDYSILSVEWDDEISRWKVKFYTDYGISDTVIRCVKKLPDGNYIETGPFYDH